VRNRGEPPLTGQQPSPTKPVTDCTGRTVRHSRKGNDNHPYPTPQETTMPNWVHNIVTISGDPATLDQAIDQLNRPFTIHHEDEERTLDSPVFSFWNIVSPPPAALPTYFAVRDPMDAELTAKGVAIEDRFAYTEQHSMHWYPWNVRNWGTKWDVYDAGEGTTTKSRHSENTVTYTFDTAWAPPVEALTNLSAQYPTLTIELNYTEEQGWGGESEFRAGVHDSVSEWDIPTTHADRLYRTGWCWCEGGEAEYADCPNVSEAAPHAA
jgi:hypothetical protein